jgi:hypothetical protein
MLIRGIARTILKYIMFPDEQAGWLPFALHRGHHIMRQHDVDVIFSSSAPSHVTSSLNVCWQT